MTEDAIIFERFRLQPSRRALLENDVPVRIGSRAFDILLALARAKGEVVASRRILEQVWPDVHVDPAALRVHISALRGVLGFNAAGTPFIGNVPGRGYRLAAERIAAADSAEASAQLKAPPGRPLPVNLVRLIGRDDLVESLCQDVPRRQFLTIVGPGGVGKTSLALEVAARLSAIYDQVVLADLGATTSPETVSRTVALAFGLSLGVEDPVPALATLLCDGRRLLVLDNCEHVIEAAALLAERLCATAPGVDILATSREPLRAQGEWVYRLQPLSFPPENGVATAADALRYPSIQLFVERASARSDTFRLTDENAAQVGDIVRRLEGVPLAIELAASWSDVFTVGTLAERLDGRLMLRAQGRRSAPARQRTLRALIDWSHDLLAEPERRLFRRLSVFAGEFSLDAARTVAADDADTPDDIVDGVASLASKSLLAVAMRDETVTYHLLMAPRAYAAEQLDRAGEAAATRRRHLLWVLDELGRAETSWSAGSRADWLQAQMGLLDEVRAAAAWAVSEGGDLDIALSLASETAPLWFRYSLTFEGRHLSEAVLHGLEGRGGLEPSQELCLRTALGVSLMFTRAPNADVTANWTRVLGLAQAQDAAESEMLAHWGLWLMAAYRCDARVQLAHAEAFAGLAAIAGSEADRRAGRRLLASAWFCLGELDRARDAIEALLTPAAVVDSAPGVLRYQFDHVAQVSALLARIYWLQGRFDDARRTAQASVEAAERGGHGLSLAYAVLDAVAHIAILLREPVVAHAALDRHLAMPEAQGLQATEAVEAMRAIAFAEEGRLPDAMVILRKTFADPSTSRMAGRFPTLIGPLAEILGEGGRADLGLALIADTLARFVRDPDDVMLPDILRAEGVLRASTGQVGAGRRLLERAVAEAARRGASAVQQRAATQLAALAPAPAAEGSADLVAGTAR